ncbi:ABC transporter substrate-binding protein [Rubrimonas sp.]|uniref:ABC transporter substrate-binding protein n=1 Tax=Rubrimonas sp. TaxID=2036015 RepID=UPI002FDE5D9C
MKILKGAVVAAALAAQPIAATVEANEIVWGDTLPAGLDPHVVYDVPMQFYMLNVYDTLFRYIGNPPELEPWLASGYEVSADGQTWTFSLKDDVQFHDGSALTAEDVVYSFQRLLNLRTGPAGAFLPVLDPEGVEAVDDMTVRFTLKQPYAPFLSAVPLVAILNKDVVEANAADGDWGRAWLSSNSAGSGAYVLDPATYVPQERVDLAIFRDHFYGWNDNPNPIEIVRAYPVAETSTRVLALINGEIDATDSYLPTDQIERIARAEGVRVAQDESMRVMVIRMNNAKPPFDNVNFRKCVSHAFDYEGFIDVILGGFPVRNAGPNPQNLWGAPDDLAGYDYDLEEAARYCDAARSEGAPVDRGVEIHIQSALEQTTQAAEVLQAGLGAIGVNLEIVPSTWAQLTSSTGSAETTPDMWIHWVSTYFVDPENWIGQMYDTTFAGTWKASSWYANDRVDELLRSARAEPEQATRAGYYEEASRLVVEDAADIWIYNTVQLRGLSERIEGYKFSPVGSGGEIRWISISK